MDTVKEPAQQRQRADVPRMESRRDPQTPRTPDEQEFRSWLHPSEQSRAPLATAGALVVLGLALLLTLASAGTVLLVVPALWISQRLAEAQLLGNAVLVSEHSFPELDARIRRACTALGYRKPVQAFVINDGEVNAVLWRFFGRRYLALNAGLVASMTPAEQTFVVGRFVGALRARHLRFHELAGVIDAFQKLWVLNLLVLPYLRATVLSGDRIGLRLCGDPQAGLRALDKLIIGKDLAPQLDPVGMERQAAQVDGTLFKQLVQLFSSHPFHTDRYRELRHYAEDLAARD